MKSSKSSQCLSPRPSLLGEDCYTHGPMLPAELPTLSIGRVPAAHTVPSDFYLEGTAAKYKRSGRAVLWIGFSRFDGRPIALVCSGRGSGNTKTGSNVAQLTVIPLDVGKPSLGVSTDRMMSVCGGCPKQRQGECYTHGTVIPKGVTSMFNALCEVRTTMIGARSDHAVGCVGTYPDLRHCDASTLAWLFSQRKVRFMQFGDSASLPREVFERVFAANLIAITRDTDVGISRKDRSGSLAYTHAWKDQVRDGITYLAAPWLKWSHMASVSTHAEAAEAQAMGWRTFRDTTTTGDKLPNEIWCPATEEGGEVANCDECGLCAGNTGNKRSRIKSIVLMDHGPNARYAKNDLVQIAG